VEIIPVKTLIVIFMSMFTAAYRVQ
jgi:hypothetical protein